MFESVLKRYVGKENLDINLSNNVVALFATAHNILLDLRLALFFICYTILVLVRHRIVLNHNHHLYILSTHYFSLLVLTQIYHIHLYTC